MAPPAPSSESAPSGLARLGERCGGALIGASACALPTAYRVGREGGGVLAGWLVATAVLLTVFAPVVWLGPCVARGWRGVVGVRATPGLKVGLGLWASVAVLLLAGLGALLKATTHHRGLGGAAFGALGAGAVVVAAVVAARLVAVGAWLRSRGWPPMLPLVGGGLLVLAAVVVLLGPAVGAGAPRAALCDVVLALAALGWLVSREPPVAMRRASRLLAMPLGGFVVLAGFAHVELSTATAAALQRAGGLPALALGLLERWSDRDGDGAGAHFGGGDCDEGDPRRHPGAAERAGDGVDSDCDGRDDPPGAPAATAVPPPSGSLVAVASAIPTAAATSAPAPTGGPSPSRPDIVLVTLDTVRADLTSAYGFEKPTTPELAALGARGMLFEHAYGAGSDTQRALVPLVSGRPLSQTLRSQGDWPTILEGNDTVAERLARAGYATAAVVSFTWLRKDKGFTQGFARFDESPFRDQHPERDRTGPSALRSALRLYADLAAGSAPLFLWLHLFDAHRRYLGHDGHDFGRDPKGLYLGEIAFVDARLGELVAAVQKGPRAARTLWIVHGSHGEAFGEHGHEEHGLYLNEEDLRVPLVVSGAGSAVGRYGRDAVSVLDLAPTILDFAGAAAEGVAGVSLRPAIAGDDRFERPPVVATGWRRTVVVDWPLKLLSYQRRSGEPRRWLYDLGSDPAEATDLGAARPDDLRRLDRFCAGAAE